MESSDFDWDKVKDIPLPEYDWKNGNPQEFYETFVKVPHPVVLRGFMEGTELMDFTYDTMLDTFGDEKVAITGKKEGGMFGKVKDVDGNPDLYVQNSEALFNKHPGRNTVFIFNNLNIEAKCTKTFICDLQSFGKFFKQRGLSLTQT